MYSEPEAYLLTFRCYGTWLPGDAPGWVADGDKFGTPFRPPNRGLSGYGAQRAQSRADDKAVEPIEEFTPAERAAAEEAIRGLCQRRGWELHAVNVRTNHVHAVVTCPCSPKQAINDMKARVTLVFRQRGFRHRDGDVWSRGGSKRYLWTPEDVAEAVRYVLEEQ